jgi:lactate permease
MLKLIFSYLPILLLIILMVKKNNMPSSKALPLTALITYFIMLIVFRQDPNLIHATVIKGLLVAWTPILIIAGAIFLFRTMEATGALGTIRQWLNKVSSNKVAQLMIVGWAFPFLIEGASGFGTPAAIAAPILIGLGFPPLRVAILALVMNSVPVSFGAVGTPTWFGFSAISLTNAETLAIGFKSAILNGSAALVIVPLALMFVVKPKDILRNWLFILLSTVATVLPYLILAKFSYEFPSLVGGAVGLVVSVLLAKAGIGLSKKESELQSSKKDDLAASYITVSDAETSSEHGNLFKATFPLWGTILLLLITRLPQLGIKQILTMEQPALNVTLGSLGNFSVSPSLVFGLGKILGTPESWSHALFYVPSLIPFVLISLITLLLYKDWNKSGRLFRITAAQMKEPTLALLGALVFVNLMMMGGDQSAVKLIGDNLAHLTGGMWAYTAQFLGALGTFFSGSNTISNLTFGGIQDAIARDLGLTRTTILALQSVGGAMGNMICINNIVAVASVLSLVKVEGYILKRTIKAMLVYGVIVGVVALFL